MLPNPVLNRLGFSNQDRVVIIHCDDIGMCQASIEAFADLHLCGGITSGAVMAPCAWFPGAALLQKRFPQADLGVHLTLTSEWQVYRWGPISTSDVNSGLLDEDGYFFHTAKQVQENADPVYVRKEMEAQFERVVQSGIHPTHVDTHMGTVAHPKFMMDYLKLAIEHKVPPMMFRMDKNGWLKAGLDHQTAEDAGRLIGGLEAQFVPLLDHLRAMPLDFPDQRYERAKEIFTNLPAGLTHFIIHPSINTPELQAITSDWACRVADYELFKSPEMKKFLQSEGIQLIGYGELENIMPETEIGI